jgi:DNA transposition AAA+ family ATPase
MTAAATRLFVATSEHERFEEFCAACQRDRYIGLCFGSPGIGKTVSARQVSRAADFEALRDSASDHLEQLDELRGLTSLLYTPDVINGPRTVTDDILVLQRRLLSVEQMSRSSPSRGDAYKLPEGAREIAGGRIVIVPKDKRKFVAMQEPIGPRAYLHPLRLLIVDEADRLKTASLEQLRHLFDRGAFGLVLIGMPGIEKRLARYPQLYSRVGFVHHYRPLGTDEMRAILLNAASKLVEAPPQRGLADPAVLAEILRITGGNLRLVVRLLTQIVRVLEVNETDIVSMDIVSAARESLVIGSS